jgi:hypothetical protein
VSLNFAFDTLVFALAFSFVIVGQPTDILFDCADNLPGFAFDFIHVQRSTYFNVFHDIFLPGYGLTSSQAPG